ncbi:MAG TPA: hypothetical protein ENJ79_10630 [Gammaproteobacteria bacterium]|nr:hypothetical protein [Gammaproteobacteria bacterium]
MMRNILLAFVLAGLTACASTPLPPMSDSAADDLMASDVAVAFVYPEKEIKYTELVYKVLWNETHATNSQFSGMWDIDREFTELFAREFEERGVHSVPINELLSKSGYKGFVESMRAYIPQQQNSRVAYSVDQQTRKELRDKGIEFLIAVRGKTIQVYDQALMDPQITMYYNLTVIDLRSGEVAYNGGFYAGGSTKVEKSAREIEDNRLAKLREVLSSSIERHFEQDRIFKSLGLVKDAG